MGQLITALVIYNVLTLAIGLWGTRSTDPESFISARGQTAFIPLILTLVATIVGGGMFLGVAELGSKRAFAPFALGAAYFLGFVMVGIMAPRLREHARSIGARTIYGVFDAMYPRRGKVGIGDIFAVFSFGAFLLMLAAQIVGGAVFVAFVSNVRFEWAVLLIASIAALLSTISYTVAGGFRRDVATDVIQMLVIIAGCALLFSRFISHGVQTILIRVPADVVTLRGNDILLLIGTLLFVAPTFLLRSDIWQRVLTARSDRQAKWAFILSGAISLLFFCFFGIVGMYSRGLGFLDARFAALHVIRRITGPWDYAIVTAAFFAAVTSSADTFLGNAAISLARGSLYRGGEIENTNNSINIRKIRKATILVGVISLLLAWSIHSVVDLFAATFGVMVVFLPTFIGGFVRANPGQKECWWSICLGGLVFAATVFWVPLEAFVLAMVASSLTYIIVMRRGGAGSDSMPKPASSRIVGP